MPELDPTSPYALLVQLAWEYQEIIERTEDPSFTVEELDILNSDRTVLHEQIIAELQRLGEPVEDRTAAMRLALRIAKWFPRSEDDYDI
jgi:hypothetical protein